MSWCLVLGAATVACAHGPREAVEKRAPALDVSPNRQVDWLPADSVAIAHLDVRALRATGLYRELAQFLPEHPPVRRVVESTDAMRLSVVMNGSEPQLSAVFAGAYDEQANPSVMSQEAAHDERIDGHDVLVRDGSHDRWFRTPEGFWLVTEEGLWSRVTSDPSQRRELLSQRAFARPPSDGAVLHTSVLMSPVWREQLASNITDPLMASMFAPAVEELRVITLDVVAQPDDGLTLKLTGEFDAARGAQAAAFLLQAAVVAARIDAAEQAQVQQDASGGLDGGVPNPGLLLGERLGKLGAQLLDGVEVQLDDTVVHATLTVTTEDLQWLRAQLSEAPP